MALYRSNMWYATASGYLSSHHPQSLTRVGTGVNRVPFFGPSKASPVRHE